MANVIAPYDGIAALLGLDRAGVVVHGFFDENFEVYAELDELWIAEIRRRTAVPA